MDFIDVPYTATLFPYLSTPFQNSPTKKCYKIAESFASTNRMRFNVLSHNSFMPFGISCINWPKRTCKEALRSVFDVGGHVVAVVAFYSDVMSSNSTEV